MKQFSLPMELEDVKKILPQREPMLLIDRVLDLEPGVRCVAEYTFPEDWYILKSHFPNYPVVPGVYLLECMSQAAGILLLTMEEYKGKTPLFAGLEHVRFRRGVFGGNRVTVTAELKSNDVSKGMAICDLKLEVDGKLCTEAESIGAMR